MGSLVRSLANDIEAFTSLLPGFETSSSSSYGWSSHTRWSPAANVSEDETGYTIELSVPGLSRGDFKVSAEDGRLTVSGNIDRSNRDSERYLKQEFGFYREFSRSWSLPSSVDCQGITARYDSGILTVRVPTEQGRKRVEIRVE